MYNSFIISSGLHYTVCTVLYMHYAVYPLCKRKHIRLSLCGQPTAAFQISINPKHNKMFIQQLSFICGPGLGKYESQFIYLSLFSRWLSGNQNKAAHKNKAAICGCSEPVSNQEHFQINIAFWGQECKTGSQTTNICINHKFFLLIRSLSGWTAGKYWDHLSPTFKHTETLAKDKMVSFYILYTNNVCVGGMI